MNCCGAPATKGKNFGEGFGFFCALRITEQARAVKLRRWACVGSRNTKVFTVDDLESGFDQRRRVNFGLRARWLRPDSKLDYTPWQGPFWFEEWAHPVLSLMNAAAIAEQCFRASPILPYVSSGAIMRHRRRFDVPDKRIPDLVLGRRVKLRTCRIFCRSPNGHGFNVGDLLHEVRCDEPASCG